MRVCLRFSNCVLRRISTAVPVSLRKRLVIMDGQQNANLQQLSALMKDDPAILQAGVSTSQTPPQTSTSDIQNWLNEVLMNPKPSKIPKMTITECDIESYELENNRIPVQQLESGITNIPQPSQSDNQTQSSSLHENAEIAEFLSELPFANEDICSNEDNLSSKVPKDKKKMCKTKNEQKLEKEEMKRRPRPNYFVAFPVSNSEIHENVKKVQNDVVKKNKAFEKTLISPSTLHITILVMHIDEENEESLARATTALEKCQQTLVSQKTGELNLKFEGVGHFSSGVLFAKVAEENVDQLKQLAKTVEEIYKKEQFVVEDKAFVAHLTVLKLSKVDSNTKKKCGRVTEALYEENKKLLFGHEKVNQLQLLSMNKPKDENGYYHCLKNVEFFKINE